MDMDTTHELEGRIDAVGQAVIWLAAALEDARLIDGPQLCRALRGRQPPAGTPAALAAASQRTLRQMADALDGARQVRQAQADQSRGHPPDGPRA